MLLKFLQWQKRNYILLSAAENMTQERKHQKENLPQTSKLQIHSHPLQKTNRHHSPNKLKPSPSTSLKTPPLLNSSKKAPAQHCNHKTNPHLHLVRTVPVHFQILATNSKCLQQKIPLPYQRNRDTAIQNLNRFNECCLVLFSHYRSLRNT